MATFFMLLNDAVFLAVFAVLVAAIAAGVMSLSAFGSIEMVTPYGEG